MLKVEFFSVHPLVYALGDLVVHAFFYFLIGCTAYFIFFKGSRFRAKRIDKKTPARKQIQAEIRHSTLTMLIFAGVGGLIYALHNEFGIFRFYQDATEYGWGYFLMSPVLLIVLHDAYFYGSHRLMHHRLFFKQVHAIHHQSFSPTPFTVYSFHFGEALIDSLFLPITVLFLPLHPIAMFVLIGASQAVNFVGHLGHEIYPTWFFRSFLAEIFTTTTHHHFHHHGGSRSNYGFYFRFWDRVCGTQDPRYEAALVKLQKRGEPNDSIHGFQIEENQVSKLTG